MESGVTAVHRGRFFHLLGAELTWRELGHLGAEGRTRTADTGIFSPVLYQLSYLGSGGGDDGI